LPIGVSKCKATVIGSTLTTPLGLRMPLNAESALEAFFGSTCCWKV